MQNYAANLPPVGMLAILGERPLQDSPEESQNLGSTVIPWLLEERNRKGAALARHIPTLPPVSPISGP